MLWELRYISTVPGNHFSGMCMAPMAPPSADTASYRKHISDIDSTFSTGVKISLWCNFIAALNIFCIYNCNKYLVVGTQQRKILGFVGTSFMAVRDILHCFILVLKMILYNCKCLQQKFSFLICENFIVSRRNQEYIQFLVLQILKNKDAWQ
jgi:hypothetical protein